MTCLPPKPPGKNKVKRLRVEKTLAKGDEKQYLHGCFAVKYYLQGKQEARKKKNFPVVCLFGTTSLYQLWNKIASYIKGCFSKSFNISLKWKEGKQKIFSSSRLFKTSLSLGAHWPIKDKKDVGAAFLKPPHLAVKEQRMGWWNTWAIRYLINCSVRLWHLYFIQKEKANPSFSCFRILGSSFWIEKEVSCACSTSLEVSLSASLKKASVPSWDAPSVWWHHRPWRMERLEKPSQTQKGNRKF